jgi:putative acetyltransferase
MISLIRTDSNNKHFRNLISLLDNELNIRNGTGQKDYNKYNIIYFLDTVVVAFDNDQPVGCGCFKVYNESTVEIKRMFVKQEMRGKGISKLILEELERWVCKKNFSAAILETGINQTEAINLYKGFGYKIIENYGQYAGMPNSICMKKVLV